jgi:hypothetical protein
VCVCVRERERERERESMETKHYVCACVHVIARMLVMRSVCACFAMCVCV